MARNDPTIYMRIPQELKDQLDAAAAANRRSLTAEVVARLQGTFPAEPLTRIPSPPLADYAQRAAIREQLQAREMAKTFGVGPAGEVAKEMFEKMRAEDEERFQKLVTGAVKSAVEQQAEAMKKGVYEELLRAIVGPKDQGQK